MGITKENNTVEEIEVLSYNEELKKINNPLADKDLSYFLENHENRIQELKESKTSEEDIFNFLVILTNIEQDKRYSIKDLPFSGSLNTRTYRSSYTQLVIPSGFSSPTRAYMFLYAASILPYCCGVTEFGNFNFYNYTKVDRNLVFNLVIDLIRLSANNNRIGSGSGAVGLINYFVHLPFGDVLKKRDDLTFIKEFTNPKTTQTLKMYIFNTKI